MPLSLTSRVQVTASRFWNKRNATALSHHGVRLDYDPESRRAASLILGFTLTLVAVGVMFLMSWFKPAGQVGLSKILADRDSGAVYVLVDGRLHPALNLMSARLIAGENANPTFVKAAEIAKFPSGPVVGIAGAPAQMPIRTGAASLWTICDTAPTATAMTSAGTRSVVTAIAGPLSLGSRSAPLQLPNAILGSHGGKTYLVWDGHRSEVDIANKAVALALGVDSAAPEPVPLSNALFDAVPATDPLISPAIPNAGQPAPWDLGAGAVIGSVLSVKDLASSGTETLYVLLPNGVQRVSPFVAALLRSVNSYGDLAPVAVSPDRLAAVPVVDSFPVSYYPSTRLRLVDTQVNATTCLTWSKAATDRAATMNVLTGQGLPISPAADGRLVQLVKDTRTDPASFEADRVYIDPAATNLVMTTSTAPTAQSRDALWWISDQGVRFGIELDQHALESLGISPQSAGQAPWPLVRVFAAGPALTRADAMTQHDSLAPAAGAQPLTPAQPGG